MRAYSLDTVSGPLRLEEIGSGHTLICLHGLGGGAYFFSGLGHRLKDRFRVVAFDLPGTGRNRVPVPDSAFPTITGLKSFTTFTMRSCVATLAGLLKSHEPGTVSVLGHSLGTIIALLAEQAAPGRLRSMIFVGGLPTVTRTIRERLGARAERIRKTGMAGIGAEAVAGIFSRRFLASNPETVALFASRLEANQPDEYLGCLEELLRADATPALGKINLPCLALTGTEDQYAPPEAVIRFGTGLSNPATYLELQACGHMPFLENPEAFAQEIGRFLDSVLNPAKPSPR